MHVGSRDPAFRAASALGFVVNQPQPLEQIYFVTMARNLLAIKRGPVKQMYLKS